MFAFGTRLNFSEESSPDEEECRQYHVAILRAQEIERKRYDILGTPPSYSAIVHVGYHSLSNSMRPIESIIDRIVTPHNPGQNTNPTTSYVMFVPNPPRSSTPGAQPSIHVSSSPSSVRGQP